MGSIANSVNNKKNSFKKSFELETDNHFEIEISIPPLYFQRGDTEKASIRDAHDSLRNALKQAREETIAEGEAKGSPSKLNFLTGKLRDKGIGLSGWDLTEQGGKTYRRF